jgi:hypothetical protein
MMPNSSTSDISGSKTALERMNSNASISQSNFNLPTNDNNGVDSSSDSSSSSSEGGTYAIVRSKYLKQIKKQKKLRPRLNASRPPLIASSSNISLTSKDLVKNRIAKATSIPLESIMTSNGNVFSGVLGANISQPSANETSNTSIVETLSKVAEDEASLRTRTANDLPRRTESTAPSQSQQLPRPLQPHVQKKAATQVLKSPPAVSHKAKEPVLRIDKDLIARLDMAKAASAARGGSDVHLSASVVPGTSVLDVAVTKAAKNILAPSKPSPDASQCSFPAKASLVLGSQVLRKSPASSRKDANGTPKREQSARQSPSVLGSHTSPFGALTSTTSPPRDMSYLGEDDRWEDSPVSRMPSSSPARHLRSSPSGRGEVARGPSHNSSPMPATEGGRKRSKSPKRDRSRSPARNEYTEDSALDRYYSSPFEKQTVGSSSFGGSPDDAARLYSEYPPRVRAPGSPRVPSPPKQRSPKISPKNI